METAAENPDFHTLHCIHKGRWMEGLRRSLSIFLAVWHIITVNVLKLAGKSKGPEWELIGKMWYDIRFLQIFAGVIDIAVCVSTAEKKLQAHDITFVERDGIMQEVETAMRGQVADQAQFSALMQAIEKKDKGVHVFRGVKLHMGGDMKPSLRRIRDGFLQEMQKRFANR